MGELVFGELGSYPSEQSRGGLQLQLYPYSAHELSTPGDGSSDAITLVQFSMASDFGWDPKLYPSLTQFVSDTADFTVAAGSFDGTSITMPYPCDIKERLTTYREAIGSTKSLDWLLYRRRIAAQRLHEEPVIILGHPRTGGPAG